MSQDSNNSRMPTGKDSIQVKTTVTKRRKEDLEEASLRAHLPSLSVFIFQAIEEKLQRDCPDIHKRGLG